MSDEIPAGQEAESVADELAMEIRRRRHTAGLSQRELARLTGYTREYVCMAERTGANLPSPELVGALDGALDAGGALVAMRGEAKREQLALRDQRRVRRGDASPPEDSSGPESLILDSLRQALLGIPRQSADEAELEHSVTRTHRLYQSADYEGSALALRQVIGQLGNATPRTQAVSYLAAAKLSAKVGDAGLAWVAADRCLRSAVESGQSRLVGIANYQLACALLIGGHADDAEETASGALEHLTERNCSVRGALHLLLAVMAARQGQAVAAVRHLRHAGRLAESDGNVLWTAFGPTNVAIHELGVHVALGNTRAASSLGEAIDTDALPPVLRGRRSQVHLELACAAAGEGDDGLAVLHLLEAERVAAQTVSRNATARILVHTLLSRERKSATPGLRALAGRAGVRA